MAERREQGEREAALERLRALDWAIAERGASARARERVRRRIQQGAVERRFHVMLRWWPVAAFAAGASTMAVLLVPDGLVGAGRGTEVVEVAEAGAGVESGGASPSVAAAPSEPVCAVLRPGVIELAADACAFGDGVHVSALHPSRLRWEDSKAELQSGELLFAVNPRSARPLHVTMGTIDIEVVGTRFVVHHGMTGAWVSLLEGHVRARVGDGVAKDVRVGERLDWPQAVVSGSAIEAGSSAELGADAAATDSAARVSGTTSPSAVGPTPARPGRASAPLPREPDEGLAELLDQVAALRREGSYREAVDLLRAADMQRWSSRARQLVSYEIGTLLERQLGDTAQACAHWTEHRRRFPSGRHDAIVSRSLERLGCRETR